MPAATPAGSVRPPLRTPWTLLRFVAKQLVVKATTPEVADFIFEVGGALADDAIDQFRAWRQRPEEEQQADVESLATAEGDALAAPLLAAFDEAASERGLDVTPAHHELVRQYARQMPGAARHTLSRPDDRSGRTVTQELLPRTPEELARLLPPRLPRFKPGDRVPDSTLVLRELLGVGSFGEVWRAENPNLRSAAPAAVKFCLDPGAAASLRRERDLLDRLQSAAPHPGIVRLRNLNLDCGTPWLEYDYVAGGTLAGFIGRLHADAPADPARVTDFFFRIVEPVAHAHAMGIVHRDLKPANVLVAGTMADPAFLVTDFGIGGLAAEHGRPSPDASPDAARGANLRGSYTHDYASPEQRRGAPPDPRDDVHALGVLWVQMLTGELTRTRLNRRDSGRFDAGVVALINAMLEHDREDRPSRIERPAAAPVPPRPQPNGPQPNAAPTAASKPSHPPSPLGQLPADDAAPSWVTQQRAVRIGELASRLKLAPQAIVDRLREAELQSGIWPTGEDITQSSLISDSVAEVVARWMSPAQASRDAGDGTDPGRPPVDRTASPQDGEPWAFERVLGGQSGVFASAAFSADGSRILTVSYRSQTVELWDVSTGSALTTVVDPDAEILSADLAADGKRIVTVNEGHAVRVWDAARGTPLAAMPKVEGPVFSAIFSPDGARLATVSADGRSHVLSAATGMPLSTLAIQGARIRSASFSSEGGRVVTTADDQTARVWEARTGRLLRTFRGHEGDVHSASFSPDGQLLLTASADSSARLWDAETGTQSAILQLPRRAVHTAAFSPDGARIATQDSHDDVWIWDARTKRELAMVHGYGIDDRRPFSHFDGVPRIVTLGDGYDVFVWRRLR